MLRELEKKIIKELQEDLPLTTYPFREIAKRLKLSEEELLGEIKELMERGYIRSLGASLGHYRIGFKANALGVWVVPPSEVERVGKIMASFREVSHCYERATSKEWKYNLFTMIHGKSKKECQRVAQEISEKTGIKEYQLLFSMEELKKTNMKYF